MEQVIPGLFIGDYSASQDADALKHARITSVVAAMRQEYSSSLNVLRIPVDDTASTNIIAHFPASNSFIRAALARDEAVLVHCQAGVSRSTTLVAAFLMQELDLDVERAIEMVRNVRSQVEPTEFFLHQLEMFERCECEWDPVKWIEQRRFLMSFAQAQIMDGASPALVLAYYPSPAPSPRSDGRGGLKMTPVGADDVSGGLRRQQSASGESTATSDIPHLENGPTIGLGDAKTTAAGEVPTRKRLTARSAGKQPETKPEEKNPVEKIGTKGQVVITGKRVRCKMCRRELAGRDHILVHEPGKGQQAFAPHRRDMGAHRAEQERRRLDEIDRENREAAETPAPLPSATSSTPAPASTPSLPAALAGLHIARPLGGLRPAVARPLPRPKRTTTPDFPPSDDPPIPAVSSLELNPLIETDSSSAAADEPDLPLLPSHLCSSYFVEPLSWMSSLLEGGALSGKLVCPSSKCAAKLGSFDWAGLQCSCGAWVLPGFALNVSKVDEFKPIPGLVA